MKLTSMLVFASLVTIGPALAQARVQEWNGDALEHAKKAKKSVQKVNGKPIASKLPVAKPKHAAPNLNALSYGMAPPGATLTITGQNFAPKASDNQVFFNSVQAQVTAASPTSISVIVPQWSFGPSQLGVQVSVVSAGVKSTNRLKMDIGSKYLLPSQM